jgi:hypothetical protein
VTRFLLNVIIMLMLTSAPLMAGCQTMSQSEDARINAVIKSQLAEEHFDLTR